MSMDGMSNDHTEAAIITPEANPNSAFSTLLFILFFITNTMAAPRVVPINGTIIPVVKFISFPPLKYSILQGVILFALITILPFFF